MLQGLTRSESIRRKYNYINEEDPFYERILFIPYNETYESLKNIQIRIFHLKLCINLISLHFDLTSVNKFTNLKGLSLNMNNLSF